MFIRKRCSVGSVMGAVALSLLTGCVAESEARVSLGFANPYYSSRWLLEKPDSQAKNVIECCCVNRLDSSRHCDSIVLRLCSGALSESARRSRWWSGADGTAWQKCSPSCLETAFSRALSLPSAIGESDGYYRCLFVTDTGMSLVCVVNQDDMCIVFGDILADKCED